MRCVLAMRKKIAPSYWLRYARVYRVVRMLAIATSIVAPEAMAGQALIEACIM